MYSLKQEKKCLGHHFTINLSFLLCFIHITFSVQLRYHDIRSEIIFFICFTGLISGGSGSVLGSAATANITNTNPYIAFRRRTEKMQTRKNRKNDEASYEKMLKLRRDLSRAVVLLEMVKRREKTKKENLTLTA